MFEILHRAHLEDLQKDTKGKLDVPSAQIMDKDEQIVSDADATPEMTRNRKKIHTRMPTIVEFSENSQTKDDITGQDKSQISK